MTDLFEKTLMAGLGLFDLTKEKAEKVVNELIKRGELNQSDKAKAVKEILKKQGERTKEFKKKVDRHIEKSMKKLKVISRDQLDELNKKIEKLSRTIEKLEKKLEKK